MSDELCAVTSRHPPFESGFRVGKLSCDLLISFSPWELPPRGTQASGPLSVAWERCRSGLGGQSKETPHPPTPLGRIGFSEMYSSTGRE